MAETFYRIENLRKAFGDAEVLRSVTFELKERDVFALIGPSGAGKTTLLRSIDFLDRPDGGVMTFKNKRIELASRHPGVPQAHVLRLSELQSLPQQNGA